LKDSENHMIKELRAGRESAWEELFKTYYRPLSVFAVKYLEDLEISKEIVQDLFAFLFETRKSLVITVSLESYLYRSVRNRCLNHIHKQQTREKHLARLHAESANPEDLEAMIRETELEHLVFRIVSSLPPRCREIFMLSRVDGRSNEEIAKMLKISKRTVETQVSNALKALREQLPSIFS
jgi:RNA polymerase sigma-70 factor (family 1)